MATEGVQKCSKIPMDETIPMDEFVIFKGMRYVHLGAGVSGITYISDDLIEGNKHLIKIVPYDGKVQKNRKRIVNTRFTNEVAYQNMAARKGLGPKVYEFSRYGVNPSDSDLFRFIDHSYFCQYAFINYMEMEYYNPDDGWRQLLPWELTTDDHEDGVRHFMWRLIYEAGVVNLEDVASHIFYNEEHGYRMIDYDHAMIVGNKDKDELLQNILTKLGLQDNNAVKKSRKMGGTRRIRMNNKKSSRHTKKRRTNRSIH
jgi:hypothetical protein